MGQFEYTVGLAAMKPHDVEAVALAFNAGYSKGRSEIISELEKKAVGGNLSIPVFLLKRMLDGNS